MTIKEAIDQVKQLFAVAEHKFADYKVSEDLTIRIDGDPVMGADVFVVAPDGSVQTAPDGTHVIPDLGTIETMGGKITVEPVAAVAEVEAAETPAEAVEEVAETIAEVVPEVPAEVVAGVSAEVVAEIMEKLSGMESEMLEMKKQMMGYKEREKAMFSVVEKLAAEPSTSETPANVLTQHFTKPKTDNMDHIIKAVQNLKSNKN
jgi:hypothetical protein